MMIPITQEEPILIQKACFSLCVMFFQNSKRHLSVQQIGDE